MASERENLLTVDDLTLSLRANGRPVRVLDGVSFEVGRGEIAAMVGESGSGKSVTSLAILRLLPSPPWARESGRILFQGRDLTAARERDMRKVRGKEIAIVLQEPMTALNPFLTIGAQVAEVLVSHLGITRSEAKERAVSALAEVGMPAVRERMNSYPHQLSGGQKQRAMIAMSLALRPLLLLADEPTTALDLTIQAQITDLLARKSGEHGMAVLFITHDLGLARSIAERVLVMYAGFVVESGPTEAIFTSPLHPYTRALIQVLSHPVARGENFNTIPGTVPRPGARPSGCPFHPRCDVARPECSRTVPGATGGGEGRSVRCWLY
jgi:oligopeptide/dipeptide ABC transporter ATP-binding protein